MKNRRMKNRNLAGVLHAAAAAGLLLGALTAQAQPFYQLESALTIRSASLPNWDYLAYDADHDYLYIARREDGILIYDAKAKKIVGTLENTTGGNATTLVRELDRGFVTNLDGSVTVFQLSTLKTIERVKFGENADNAFYDPATGQLLVTMGDSRQAAFLDAKTGALVGRLAFDSEKLEGTVADGEGTMFMALRDRNKVVRIDMKKRQVTAEWTPESCELPNGAAYDRANKRLFVSCRGNSPILAVIDPATGKTVAKPAIGRGNDVVVFDPDSRRIYASNGFDGTLVVIQQVNADTYRLVEAATTRPYARTMALDPKTKKVYLVTAEGTVDPAKGRKREIAEFYPNKYFADTFTLLTYAPK